MRNHDGHAPAGTAAASATAPSVRGLADSERALAEIFAAVLDLPDLATSDNFFDLGVTSLMMVRARTQIKERFGRDVPVEDLFAHPNIAELARFLEGEDGASKALGSAQARGARQNDLFQKLRKFAGKASR